jgi:hypothetical protein
MVRVPNDAVLRTKTRLTPKKRASTPTAESESIKQSIAVAIDIPKRLLKGLVSTPPTCRRSDKPHTRSGLHTMVQIVVQR